MPRRVKHRAAVELTSLDRRPPVLVDSRDFEPLIAPVARDQEDFGGIVHARLEPHLGRIQVLLRYGGHRVPAGWCSAEQLGTEAFAEVTRIYRKGRVADCPVQLISRVEADGRVQYEVWLNPHEATQSSSLSSELRPA